MAPPTPRWSGSQAPFGSARTDVPYRPAIGTAPVRAMYEATVPLPGRRHAGGGHRQGERGQGRCPERRDQRLDHAVFRLPRRRLHPRPAGAQGADAGHSGRSPGRRGRRAGRHRERLHGAEQPGGECRSAGPIAAPVSDGGVPPLVYRRAHRPGPGARGHDPERGVCRIREGDRDSRRRLSHSVPAPPADRRVRRRAGRHRLRGHGDHRPPASLPARQAARPADRLPAPSGGLDRGARDLRVAAEAAGPLVPRAARVPALSPGHAVALQVRPDRLVCAARLLAVRVLRPPGGGRGLPFRSLSVHHGAAAGSNRSSATTICWRFCWPRWATASW